MAVDYEKVGQLRNRIFFSLSKAAQDMLDGKGIGGVRLAVADAAIALDELDAATSMDVLAGGKR